jgi:endonuclease-8
VPEGHSVHRIAIQFQRNFVGKKAAVSSPQGRFASGAALLTGREMKSARAVGKHLFLEFEGDRWLRVHLGIYGAWDFLGSISPLSGDGAALRSIGAPRLRRAVHMAETERERQVPNDPFPPPPIGAVRVRIATATAVADLRGPTACEVLDPAQVEGVLSRLGPDPVVDSGPRAEERFVAAIAGRSAPIGVLLMDQSVVSGIGNVYRAEILFRARLNPHTKGKNVPRDVAVSLWRDWAHLLRIGVETGHMLTIDPVNSDADERACANAEDRHWVYKREGLPCRLCGGAIAMEVMASRKLYWCPIDQA